MKSVVDFSAILLFLSASVSMASDCKTLDSLRWINGGWVHEDEKKIVAEEWDVVKPLGKDEIRTFEGMGEFYSKKDGSKTEESLRIVEMSGEVFYLAKVSENQFPVPFKLIECSENGAVFSNDKHDFPNLIRYSLSGIGTLDVYVGDSEGKGFNLQFKSQKDL